MLEGEGPKSVWLGQNQGASSRVSLNLATIKVCSVMLPPRVQGRIWASGPLGLWPNHPHLHFRVHLSCSAHIHHLLGLWGDIFVSDSFFQSSKLSFSLLVNIVILSSLPTPLPSLPLLFLPLSFSLLHTHPQLLIMVKSFSILQKSSRLNHKSAGPTCIIEAQDMNMRKNPSTLTLTWPWEWRLVWLGPQANGLEEARTRFSPGASGGSITLLTLIMAKFELTLDLLPP